MQIKTRSIGVRHRVFTYITREQQLLLLRYPDGRYVLPQIPGGTV